MLYFVPNQWIYKLTIIHNSFHCLFWIWLSFFFSFKLLVYGSTIKYLLWFSRFFYFPSEINETNSWYLILCMKYNNNVYFDIKIISEHRKLKRYFFLLFHWFYPNIIVIFKNFKYKSHLLQTSCPNCLYC